MKTCTYCGKEYPDEASVCAIDGQSLVIAPAAPALAEEEKHSALGIASFSISIAVGCLMVGLLIVASVLNASRSQHGQTYPGQVIVGLVAIFLMAADVVAAGLGIAALCQPARKRLFGLLDLVFSSGTILGSVGLIVIGLSYAGKLAR